MVSGLYEESIGDHYCCSLRTVLGENDAAGRMNAFSYTLVVCAILLALFAFWFGKATRAKARSPACSRRRCEEACGLQHGLPTVAAGVPG
jgi:hypothetical protein